jgi:hypothetical protein
MHDKEQMIIYNITTLVSWSIHEDWQDWITNEFLPKVMATELFMRFQVVRLLEVNEEEGPTYAVQLYAEDREKFEAYREKHLRRFQQMEQEAWGDYATSFASLMKIVN